VNFSEPIAGELGDDEMVGAAEAIVERLDALLQLQMQQAQLLAQQGQILGMLAQQLTAPKRVVRDEQGRISGVEPVQG